MASPAHIPISAKLRAEQVHSWAHQAAYWGGSDRVATIEDHHSAKAILSSWLLSTRAQVI
jgi:hypothetical protein